MIAICRWFYFSPHSLCGRGKSLTPFHVVVGQFMLVMQFSQRLKKPLVELMLPVFRALLAEKNATAQRANVMCTAQAVDLPRTVVVLRRRGGSRDRLVSLCQKPCDLQACDVEAVAKGVELTAAPADPAGRPMRGDGSVEVGVELSQFGVHGVDGGRPSEPGIVGMIDHRARLVGEAAD